MEKKTKLIERINNLKWGDILWGKDKDGNTINVNDYNEKDDTFGIYGDDGKYHYVHFEDLPQKLMRA